MVRLSVYKNANQSNTKIFFISSLVYIS